MAKRRHRAHFGPQEFFFGAHEKARRRHNRLANRSLRIEPCEERKLLAVSPTLIAVIPNEGVVIPFGGSSTPTVSIAPRELTLRFDEGQVLNPSSLSVDAANSSVTLTRANFDDNLIDGNNLPINIGFIGIGEKPNEVVLRFAENLPDDKYRLHIDANLKNTSGLGANPRNVEFDLNLGAQVIAVVPQPVSRGAGGALTQATNQVVVYFNNDDLNSAAANSPLFYELIRTGGTASNLDDTVVNPTSVFYENVLDKATLTFGPGVLQAAGTYRLRIGNSDPLPGGPQNFNIVADPGSTFGSANDLGVLFTAPAGLQAAQLSASIDPQTYTLAWPGGTDEPGHRQIRGENHFFIDIPDTAGGIPTIAYNFQDNYGFDPDGQQLHNLITEAQKQRAREVFSLISYYSGVQFVETADLGITVATGDIRAVGVGVGTGPGGVVLAENPFSGVVVLDLAEDWGESEFGGTWFRRAMQGIQGVLGVGDNNDTPQLATMNSIDPITGEIVVPGDADIVHLQRLFRPDSKDIDTYKFTLQQEGTLSFETVAQRLGTNATGWLDSVISVYDSAGNLVARNDDYYGTDSFVRLELEADTYFVAVTAAGNTAFDLNAPDTGLGGRTQGDYQLRMNFVPTPVGGLTDATGVLFDGDADGKPGGAYNFWFKTQTAARTIWVDKAATGAGVAGTLADPLKNISLALARANPGDIVRIVGNNFANDPATLNDNLTYNIGFDILGNALTDGSKMEIPLGVTVMIDAGAIFRLRAANIDAGSSAQGIDRSGGALQVLGTPTSSVIFTSWHDEATGKDIDPRATTPQTGDWGGLVFREDSDLEQEGIFLSYVNHADFRYSGGQVVVNSVEQVFDPIHMIEARPTISFNKITLSADAAMSADPNSFEETEFQTAAYVADYGRVGPDIHGNTLTNNTFNALFVRISTAVGENVERLTVSARFDDTDVVHALNESLLIAGDAGEGTFDPDTGLVTPRIKGRLAIDPGIVVKLAKARIETEIGAQFLAEANTSNPVIFSSLADDRYGRGGTFDSSNDGVTLAQPGEWAGLYFGPASSASIDYARIMFAGGESAIEGGPAFFNAVETDQASLRLAHSLLEDNAEGIADGQFDPNRNGRLTNDSATIFVRGAQPRLLSNVIRNNVGSAISINVNSLNWQLNNDSGRSIGPIDLAGNFYANAGPLVTGNKLTGNDVDGMEVRGGELTTQSIWDDTDIEHFVFDEIIDRNFHTYGGLRLQSTVGHSLVVSLVGDNAGFTASGLPLDIDDRIGGSVQVLGVPGWPVVLSSPSTASTSIIRGNTPDVVFVIDTSTSTFSDFGGTSIGDLNGDGLLDTIFDAELAAFIALTQELIDQGRADRARVSIVAFGSSAIQIDMDQVAPGVQLATRPNVDANGNGTSDVIDVLKSIEIQGATNFEAALQAAITTITTLGPAHENGNLIFLSDGVPNVGDAHDDEVATLQGLIDNIRAFGVGPGALLPDLQIIDPTAITFSSTDELLGIAGGAEQWRSVRLDRYSNDRNVALVNELEQSFPATGDANGMPTTAQGLGQLAPNERSGDDNARLGFEVRGAISQTFDPRGVGAQDDRLADVDVYSFRAQAGTEVWLDIDRTSQALDAVLELVDANGSVIARSNDSTQELLSADPLTFNSPNLVGALGSTHVMTYDVFNGQDLYTTNPRDPGMRVILPGSAGATATYYVRVRANNPNLADLAGGRTAGLYQLQVRLREIDENPGSTVQYAEIRNSTSGIEVLGKPAHSPLLGEAAETTVVHNSLGQAQDLGNLLANDRNTLGVSGNIVVETDVDWYKLTVDFQHYLDPADPSSFIPWPTIFDLDYADGTGRVNASLAVYDQVGKLVYWSRGGGIDDDQPRPLSADDLKDLSRGSLGILDPYIGSVDLNQDPGQIYYVAVSSNAYIPLDLKQFTDAEPDAGTSSSELVRNIKLVRLEPVEEYNRIFTNRVDTSSGLQTIGLNVNPLTLNDLVLFTNTDRKLYTVAPFTGNRETSVTFNTLLPFVPDRIYGDIVMRDDGELYTFTHGFDDATSGNFIKLNTGDGSLLKFIGDDGIITYQLDPETPFDEEGNPNYVVADVGVHYNAMTFTGSGADASRHLFAVGTFTVNGTTRNVLVELNPNTGKFLDIHLLQEPPDPDSFLNVSSALLPTLPTILGVSATDVDDPITAPGDVVDGDTITVTGPPGSGGTVTFEINTGLEVRFIPGNFPPLDGSKFTLNNVTFEFEQGAFITVGNANSIVDGATFQISNADATVVFEFNRTGGVTGTNVAINVAGADNATVATRIAEAINGSGLRTDQAGPLISFVNGNRVGLDNGLTVDTAPAAMPVGTTLTPAGFTSAQSIPYEFNQTMAQLGASIVSAVNNAAVPGFVNALPLGTINASAARDRITFYGADLAQSDFSLAPVFQIQPTTNSNFGPGTVEIAIGAGDSADTVAQKIRDAINANNGVIGLPNGAGGTGSNVEIAGGSITSTGPFTAFGSGTGGNITGLATVNGLVYAVSNTGSIYRVDAPGPSATLALITSYVGVQFSGLSAGPKNVEGGRYVNMLFASDSQGKLYAFDTQGIPQPIFLNGATSIATEGSLVGLAFSPVDYNLWHVSNSQAGVDGHSGKLSYYFGLDPVNEELPAQPGAANFATNEAGIYNTYDVPGGAHGSLTTDAFDLAGYTDADMPTLYFTYYYNGEVDTVYDTARVFISTDNAHWKSLFLDADLNVITPFRNTNSWRQARIDLTQVKDHLGRSIAGQTNIRVRFDFSTAGDLAIDNNRFGGVYLSALAGNQLADGNTFTIGGNTFEFDLGPIATMQSGPKMVDGHTVKVTVKDVNDVLIATRDFEFDKDGIVGAGNVAVSILENDTANDVALRLAERINNASFGVTAKVDAARVNLRPDDLANDIDASANGNSASIVGATGVGSGNVTVPVDIEMTAEDVAEVMGNVIDNTLVTVAGNVDDPLELQSVKVDGSLLHVVGHPVNDPGVLPFSSSLPGDLEPLGTPDRFTSNKRGQNNHFLGVHIDDVIVGFASRGEMNLRATGESSYRVDPLRPSPFDPNINVGRYDLEIRRGSEPERGAANQYGLDPKAFDPVLRRGDHSDVPFPIDVRTQLGNQVSLTVNSGDQIVEGDTFRIGDGDRLVTFEFDSDNTLGGPDVRPDGTLVQRQRVAYSTLFTAGQIATAVKNAVNDRSATSKIPAGYTVQAYATGTDGRVELFYAANVVGSRAVDRDTYVGVNDGFTQQFTLLVHEGNAISDGETFQIGDGSQIAIFEFDSNNSVGSTLLFDGTVIEHQPVVYTLSMTATQVSVAVRNAINDRTASSKTPLGYAVRAFATGADNRVDLFNAARTYGALWFNPFAIISPNAIPFFIDAVTDAPSFDEHEERLIPRDTHGDSNLRRDQGYTIIANNLISNAEQFGILVDADTREATESFPGGARTLREPNTQRLAPGVVLVNNLIVNSGEVGIKISGDSITTSLGASLFARVVNNTIYGGDTATGIGILVEEGASPTIINNILSNNETGVKLSGAGTTVLFTNVYKGNTLNRDGGTESFFIDLSASDPLFVDPGAGNFYLAKGSKAIDSSRNTLDDRAAMTTVTSPLGIPPSPIVAPAIDLLGQLRVDDSSVASGSTGQGGNVFKDRGAIDRSDFIGGSVALVNPLDNDAAGKDKDLDITEVELQGQTLTNFSFQFSDAAGAGIADGTVTPSVVTFKRNNVAVDPTTYIFSYDTTTNTVRLQAAAGIFANATYTIQIDNSATGVRDSANNPLKPNQLDGTTRFTINLENASVAPWQNPLNPLDVNASGLVTPLDLGLLIDRINRNPGSFVLPLPAPGVQPFYDVNGDGLCSPADLLLVIDFLNRQAAGFLSSFESSDSSPATLVASSSSFSADDSGDVAAGIGIPLSLTKSVGGTSVGSTASSASMVAPEHHSAIDSVWASLEDDEQTLSPYDDVLNATTTDTSTDSDDLLFDVIDSSLV